MAVLDGTIRALIKTAVMRLWSERVEAADDWADSNQASFNSALPATFRTNATAAQKALILCLVVMKRAGFAIPKES